MYRHLFNLLAVLLRLRKHTLFSKDANPEVGITDTNIAERGSNSIYGSIEPAVSSIQVFDASGESEQTRSASGSLRPLVLLFAAARRGNLQGRVAHSFCRYTRDKRRLHVPGRSLGIRTQENLMVTTRAVHIAASILITGIFTFNLIMLGLTGPSESDDLHEIGRRLFRLAAWSLIAALLSALLWFWLEVASMSGLLLKNQFSRRQRGGPFCLKRNSVESGSFVSDSSSFVLVASALAEVKARRALITVFWLVSVVLLVSLALISHAAAATMKPFGVLGDMIHLCAAGLWMAGSCRWRFWRASERRSR